MKYRISLFIALLASSSCIPTGVYSLFDTGFNHDITGKWNFRPSYLPGQEDGFKAGNVNVSVENLVNTEYNGSYYVFNADGTYRSLHTEGPTEEFIEGTWKFDERDSTLHFQTDKITQQKVFKVNFLKDKMLSLSDVRPTDTTKKSYLDRLYTDVSQHYTFEEDEDVVGTRNDFTLKKANLWRIKPLKPEGESQIRKRITDNIDFAIKYLDAHLESDKKVIRYSGLASPFLFASNGIALKSMEKIKPWKDIFYDYKQASRAYDILQQAFHSQIAVPEDKTHVQLQRHLLVEVKRQVLEER